MALSKALSLRDRIMPLVGLALYISSFFMPAIGGLQGYECAWFALFAFITPLVIFGGIINPLLVVYFLLLLTDVAPRVRRYLVFIILICIPLTWTSLLLVNKQVGIGHVTWIGAILLIVLPEAEGYLKFGLLKWELIGVAILAGVYGLHITAFKPLGPPSWNDRFYSVAATTSKSPDLCSRINPHVFEKSSRTADDLVVYTLRSKCFLIVAGQLGNPKLCGKVSPPFLGLDNDTRFTSRDCRIAMRNSYFPDVERQLEHIYEEDPVRFVATMNEMGYQDEDMVKWKRQIDREKSSYPEDISIDSYRDYFLWLGSRSNPERDEFIRRVMAWSPPAV